MRVHSAAELLMGYPLQFMKCRIKKMSRVNLEVSISLRVNNINHREA